MQTQIILLVDTDF